MGQSTRTTCRTCEHYRRKRPFGEGPRTYGSCERDGVVYLAHANSRACPAYRPRPEGREESR